MQSTDGRPATHAPGGVLRRSAYRSCYPEEWSPSGSSAIDKNLVTAVSAVRHRTSPQIWAPMDEIRDKLRCQKLIVGHRPSHMDKLLANPDEIVVQWFAVMAHGLIEYYSCCDNFYKVRHLVDYYIRWSAIFTLAKKHKTSARAIIRRYTKDLEITTYGGKRLARFPTSSGIQRTQHAVTGAEDFFS